MTTKSASNLSIFFSPAAAERIREIFSRGNGKFVRIDIRQKGCGGNAYNISYIDSPSPGDTKILLFDGTTPIFISAMAEMFLLGGMIDYQKGGMEEKFVFIEKHATKKCGCGKSFHV